MKTSTTAQSKGKLHELNGGGKATMGQPANHPKRETQGENDKRAGRIRAMIWDIKKAFEA